MAVGSTPTGATQWMSTSIITNRSPGAWGTTTWRSILLSQGSSTPSGRTLSNSFTFVAPYITGAGGMSANSPTSGSVSLTFSGKQFGPGSMGMRLWNTCATAGWWIAESSLKMKIATSTNRRFGGISGYVSLSRQVIWIINIFF